MQFRNLGRSGLKVSTLTFGAATFGGVGDLAAWGTTGSEDARRLFDICFEAGINMIDTANVYSFGRSEEIVGEILSGKREQVLVASKVRLPMGDGPNDQGLSRHHIIAQCEASLQRLRTDRIDLYQMHEWDGTTALDETLSAFDALIRSGKVRYLGFSNFAGWQLMKLMETARANGFAEPVCQQIYYSLEAREAEYELIPAAIDQGLGTLVWSPLSGGLLTGKYRRGSENDSIGRRGNDPAAAPIPDEEKLFDKIDVLIAIAEERGVTAGQVALSWLLGRPGITSLVLGARTENQLRENLRAAELSLSEEERERLDAVSKLFLLYPYWHQCRHAAARLSYADLSLLGPYLESR